jgi:hypothetical protein
MTPDQQRTAIAKICGWTDIRRQRLYAGDQDLWGTKLIGGEKHRNRLPNYLGDKNAMQEAKQSLLDKGLMLEFVNLLVVIICSAKGISWSGITTDDRQMLIANATAAQEAETFLKVFKLWEEKQIPEPSFHSYHKEEAQ